MGVVRYGVTYACCGLCVVVCVVCVCDNCVLAVELWYG